MSKTSVARTPPPGLDLDDGVRLRHRDTSPPGAGQFRLSERRSLTPTGRTGHRGGEQRGHHAVEDPEGARRSEDALHRRAEGEPREAARQARGQEHEPERRGLSERAAGLPVEERRGRAGAHEPRLRVDPLKGRRADEADRLRLRPIARRTGRRDLPGEPQEKGRAAPLHGAEEGRRPQDHAAEAEGDDEHHHRHAEADPEETAESAPHADLRPRRHQQHVARPRRPGGRDREEEERDGLLPRHVGHLPDVG